MEKFIPYEKLSKKKKRELDAGRRTVWAISPVTRKPENPKAYNRRKARKRMDDPGSVLFSLDQAAESPGAGVSYGFPGMARILPERFKAIPHNPPKRRLTGVQPTGKAPGCSGALLSRLADGYGMAQLLAVNTLNESFSL